jgi:OOP family OmpA-OmpF porin
MKKSILAAAAIAALSSSSVFAGGSVFGGGSSEDGTGAIYGGASIGQSSDSTCDSVADQAGALLGNIDCPTPSAWKVFGGYKVAPNLAVEGSYIDFGDASTDGTIPVIPGVNAVPNAASLASQATGFNVSGVANAPVTNEVSVFGKAGMMIWEKETTANIQGFNVLPTKTDGVDLSLGAGAEYKINDNWGVRGELEHFNGLNNNLYSVGATFSTF